MIDQSLNNAVENMTSDFGTLMFIYVQLQMMVMLFLRFGTSGNELGDICFKTIQTMMVSI